jgi:HK97 family phage portal protein
MGILNFFKRSENGLIIPKYEQVLELLKNKGISKSEWYSAYENNVDAFSVIKKIVDASKEAPWIVQKKDTDGNWIKDDTTEIQALLENPNDYKQYTWNDIQEQVLIYLLCNGNAYLYGEKLGNKVVELDVLPSKFMDIKSSGNFFLPEVKYTLEIDSTTKVIEREDLAHIKFFNPYYTTVEEGIKGLSLFQVAAHPIIVGNNRWEADASLLQNRGALGFITNKSERPMTVEQAKEIQDSFDKNNNGTDKYGKVRVTNKDLSYVSMAMSSTDLQLLEKGVINLRAICNVFGLDSSLFNDPANKTYNNRQEAEKALYTNAVIPLSRVLAAKYNRLITRSYFPDGNYRIYQDFERVEALQKDKKMEAEKDKIVMEGINVVLNMPIGNEAKIALLIENYELSKDIANLLLIDSLTKLNTGDNLQDAPEAIDQNALAQANLRGSVGGVQGILAIQQGVASGITSISSAVTTLVEIYGFDEATAKAVLGV